ncbi:hypothetical protein ADL35_12280 [Streptomyces sp. NRRL WC-3753]|nr:hypothetical protein ADL35_12280 [Streptomyces sp. NRRL WC-3753]
MRDSTGIVRSTRTRRPWPASWCSVTSRGSTGPTNSSITAVTESMYACSSASSTSLLVLSWALASSRVSNATAAA